MPISNICITLLLLALLPIKSIARDAYDIWDSRCEECHSDAVEFANKYLWDINGQLQGQHHIDDLSLFLSNHYIPKHEIEVISEMLLANANSPLRFKTECGECHGGVETFVEKSIWVRGSGITGMETGKELREFLPTHEGLQSDDVLFYRKLFARIAGKPLEDL